MPCAASAFFEDIKMRRKDMTSEMPKAALAGCYSVDICPRFSATGEDFGEIIKPGAITSVTGNDVFPGGSAPNTGLAMKIFGVEPIYLGKIGDDNFGNMLMSMMEKGMGGPFEGLTVSGEVPTAYSLILAPEGLDRAILQNPGANDEFCLDDIDWDKLEDCRLLHFGHPPTIKRFYENGGEQLVALYKEARERGMVTSLDLCAVDPSSEAAKVDWHALLERVLPYVDFFLPSFDELRYMLWGAQETGEEMDTIKAVQALSEESLRIGATNIMIKLGDKGMYYHNADDFSDIEKRLGREEGDMKDWEGRIGLLPALHVNEVSGLGAGDVCIGAYLSSLLRGYDFDATIKNARAEGALCVTQASATGGLVPFEELDGVGILKQ